MLVYVDDILIVARSRADVDWVKEQLASKFEAHDLGEAHNFLGIDIIRVEGYAHISDSLIMDAADISIAVRLAAAVAAD